MGGALVVLRGLRRLLGVLLVLLVLAVVTTTLAPAKWLTQMLEDRANGSLVFSEVQGRWWNGQARLGLAAAGSKAVMLPGTVQWRAEPAALLSGVLGLIVTAPQLNAEPLSLRIAPVAGGLRVDATAWRAQIPLVVLQGLGAPWNTLGLSGLMQWAAGPMRYESSASRAGFAAGASGTLTLTEMASLVSPLKPLGSYAINWQSNDAEVGFTLSTTRGPLLLDARGAVVGSKLRISGTAKAEPNAVSALANLLGIIGRRQGGVPPAEGGQVSFQFG